MMTTPVYVDIAFPKNLRRQFTYQIPEQLTIPVFLGQRVVAPLRNTPTIGFIVTKDVTPPTNIKIKKISELIDASPVFPPELFRFLLRLSRYYLAPLGLVLAAAIPREYHIQNRRRLKAMTMPDEAALKDDTHKALYELIKEKGPLCLTSLKRKFPTDQLKRSILSLKRQQLITETVEFQHPQTRANRIKYLQLANDTLPDSNILAQLEKRAPRQGEILTSLAQNEGILRGAALDRFPPSSIQSLQEKGFVSLHYHDVTVERLWDEFTVRQKQVALNDDQQSAFETIRQALQSDRFCSFLIQGVTGSGKTEIYLKLIWEACQQGKSTIVLVPEITLTTHLASRFKGEFQEKIALWHSHLSSAQRSTLWHDIRRGKYQIVIGPRSAIFLPVNKLGLIIVDEEQDSSYKQQGQEPRYHGRDAALLRGNESGATVVLGSATPSLETLYNVFTGKIRQLDLPRRFSPAPLPMIHLVDMKEEWQKTGRYNDPLSALLIEKIDDRLQKGQQVLLLQNRRGYSNVILCPDCGWSPACQNCDIALTYHQNTPRMICHYCGAEHTPPDACPQCSSNKFLFPGFGTQRVEKAIKERFPKAGLARMDIDMTRKRGYAQKIMRRFEAGEIQILIGTQMIAKGLDFPNVTLVGVLNADIGLFMPDFRARERVFQLLYQVTGRSGRGEIQGEVVIQTFSPQDLTVRCAVHHNLTKFVNNELNERNPINYPPFSRLALISLSHLSPAIAESAAYKIIDFIRKRKGKIEILGPAPAPLRKLKKRYRYMIILKSRKDYDPNGGRLRKLLRVLIHSRRFHTLERKVRITVNLDPLDLL